MKEAACLKYVCVCVCKLVKQYGNLQSKVVMIRGEESVKKSFLRDEFQLEHGCVGNDQHL